MKQDANRADHIQALSRRLESEGWSVTPFSAFTASLREALVRDKRSCILCGCICLLIRPFSRDLKETAVAYCSSCGVVAASMEGETS